MKIKILLCLLFAAFSAVAQPENEAKPTKFAVKIDPLAMIDVFSCPSYRLGLEFQLYKNVSISLEGGGYLRVSPLFKNVTGYTLKTEAKMYLNKINRSTYVSLEYFYKDQSYLVTQGIRVNGIVLPKDYTMQKYINSATLKYGYVKYVGERFFFDLFCGLGIRFKNVDCIGLTPYEIQHRVGTSESEFGYFRDLYGFSVLPNIDAGVKIGYRFF